MTSPSPVLTQARALRKQAEMYLNSAEWERGRGNAAGARIAERMADRRIARALDLARQKEAGGDV